MNKELLSRTIVSIIVGVLTLLKLFGVDIPYSEEALYTAVLGVVMIVTWVWGYWKNNSFSHEAKLADEFMHSLKARRNEVGGENDKNSDVEHAAADPEEV